jgi:hypothetical protein
MLNSTGAPEQPSGVERFSSEKGYLRLQRALEPINRGAVEPLTVLQRDIADRKRTLERLIETDPTGFGVDKKINDIRMRRDTLDGYIDRRANDQKKAFVDTFLYLNEILTTAREGIGEGQSDAFFQKFNND